MVGKSISRWSFAVLILSITSMPALADMDIVDLQGTSCVSRQMVKQLDLAKEFPKQYAECGKLASSHNVNDYELIVIDNPKICNDGTSSEFNDFAVLECALMTNQ